MKIIRNLLKLAKKINDLKGLTRATSYGHRPKFRNM